MGFSLENFRSLYNPPPIKLDLFAADLSCPQDVRNGTLWQSASGWQSAGDPKTMTGVEHDAERHAMETSNHQRPETMTPQERIAEVAALLAQGLQRLKGLSATARPKLSQTSQQSLASKRKLKRS